MSIGHGDIATEIRRNLIRELAARGMKPAHLAQKLGISRSTVHAWMHGGPGPELESVPGIAVAMGTTIEVLLGDVGDVTVLSLLGGQAS